MENDKPKMKLFVAGGETSADPREWRHISERYLILAANKEEALTMTDLLDVVEVCTDNPSIL